MPCFFPLHKILLTENKSSKLLKLIMIQYIINCINHKWGDTNMLLYMLVSF